MESDVTKPDPTVEIENCLTIIEDLQTQLDRLKIRLEQLKAHFSHSPDV